MAGLAGVVNAARYEAFQAKIAQTGKEAARCCVAAPPRHHVHAISAKTVQLYAWRRHFIFDEFRYEYFLSLIAFFDFAFFDTPSRSFDFVFL